MTLEQEPLPIFSPEGFLAILLLIPGMAAAVISANPMMAVIRQSINKALPAEIPQPAEAVAMHIKGALDRAGYDEIMLRHGLSLDVSEMFLGAAEQVLAPGELLGLLTRGVIDPSKFASELARLGVSEESAANLEQMAERLLGVGELLGLLTRGAIDQGKFRSELTRIGISGESAESLEQMAETLLDPGTLIRAKFRGAPIAGSYEGEMTRLGYTPQAAQTFEEASKIIGGPSDMIRWAVREVFTPEIVAELGLADEFPSEFVAEAAKIGMEENIAENEWKAHWILPSIQQGFEMMHRRVTKRDGSVFELSDMERLLKVQDVMPFFRGLITQIAYRPFTRVDVRRMHKSGVLSLEQVNSAYLDLGFDEEKAAAMTDFTVDFNTGSEKELTKTEILRALSRQVINEDMALELFSDLRIPVEAAQIILATQAAKIAMDTTDELSDIEIDRYVDGLISEDELQDALLQLDLVAPQIELLMAKSRRKNRRAEKMPSKADILRWYLAEIIDRDSTDALLERIGIREEFRGIYLQETEAPVEG